ncbi:MAG TPA: hypothetical protein VED65_00260 [Candidatus Bathyarchaeia archaeon]|nr:hypothetical protein [Candidatus Bathyarchaeia archaeon]
MSVPHLRVTVLSLCPLLAASLLASPAPAQQEKGAGVTMSADADAKDIGLPLYPGSRHHKDKDEDSAGVNFGLWGGGSGFKLAVLKMESDDSMDKVADFYKKKLSKYGKVLDCSHPSADESTSNKDDSDDNSKPLTCGTDKPDKGGFLFKAGTKSDQRLVAIQPAAKGSLYQLVHVAHWDSDAKK